MTQNEIQIMLDAMTQQLKHTQTLYKDQGEQEAAWSQCVGTLYIMIDAGIIDEASVEQYIENNREELSNTRRR